jgi:hypothetical protein
MDAANWICLSVGLVIILGAWTNWLNYHGDDRDGEDSVLDYTSWVLFHIVFMKNRKAYRAFLWIFGLALVFLSIYTSSFVEGRLQSTPLN